MHTPSNRLPAEQILHAKMSEHSEQFGMQLMQLGGVLAGWLTLMVVRSSSLATPFILKLILIVASKEVCPST